MKYLYLACGLGLLILAVTFSFWFYGDIIHFFKDPHSYTSRVRLLGTIFTWFFGIVYFWYAVKHERINKLSNSSIAIFVLALVVSIVSAIFSPLCSVGATCPPPFIDQRLILEIATALSFILLLVSLFKTPKKQGSLV